MKNILCIALLVLTTQTAYAGMSADATFENNYSKAVRDACRAQFRDPVERLKCAQYVVEKQRQDMLIQSQINANNAQAELDKERTEWLRDNPDARYRDFDRK